MVRVERTGRDTVLESAVVCMILYGTIRSTMYKYGREGVKVAVKS